jgi:hypothetical protein
MVLVLVYTDSCGGNCPAGNCPICFCGTTKSMQDIGAWCAKYNWNQACCKCIVSHQSGGNANALFYNPNGSVNVGLWQINGANWYPCNEGRAPCDLNANLQCAIYYYKAGGNTFKVWPSHAACGC